MLTEWSIFAMLDTGGNICAIISASVSGGLTLPRGFRAAVAVERFLVAPVDFSGTVGFSSVVDLVVDLVIRVEGMMGGSRFISSGNRVERNGS